MAKYRKRGDTVEAMQYKPGTVLDGVCEDGICDQYMDVAQLTFPHAHTLGNVRALSPGDWVVHEGRHEIRVYRPHEFDKIYEKVEKE